MSQKRAPVDERFDVVVVGSGSSGGVLASRLSEDPACRVLLLEAGPDFPDEATLPPLFAVSGGQRAVPTGIPELDWGYSTTERTSKRRLRLARGRLVGGSSMVNGVIAVRGMPADYDRWASYGNDGWSWKDVLPYLKRLESDADFGDRPYHGRSGPIHVRRFWQEYWSPIDHVFFEGCLELGLRYAPDLNAPDASVGVVGPWPQSRLNQVRLGTLPTYIRAARGRRNFTIRGNALVDKVLFTGKTARGISYLEDGRRKTVGAGLVVLSAGAFGSPMILQRSGIGPRDWLAKLGIRQLAELPAGKGLLDHPNYAIEFESLRLAKTIGRLFLTNARAPAGTDGLPGWQLTPIQLDEVTGRTSIRLFLSRQDALGTVRITSRAPDALPAIDHRYNTAASDVERYADGFAFCSELVGSTAAFRREKVRVVTPNGPVTQVMADTVATSQHPAGSCRMGPVGDERAVVDPTLGVHGFERLMVADASVFPDMVVNNINLTCHAIGEKGADLARARLA
jgi:choline dehydrogenase